MKDELTTRFPEPSEAFGVPPRVNPVYGNLGNIPQPPQQQRYVRNASDPMLAHGARPASPALRSPSGDMRVPRRPVGGFAPAPPPPTPPISSVVPRQAPSHPPRPDLRSLFDDVDRHKRGYLTERELSSALVNGDYTRFDPKTVRLMIQMFDRDGDGAVYFAEFGQLWKYLHEWRNIFDRFDVNGSQKISLEEFSSALTAFGYNLSPTSVEFMFKAGSRLGRNGLPEMSFDMFVQSCINIKSITDIFKRYDTDRDGYVTMSFEEFMLETTKLH